MSTLFLLVASSFARQALLPRGPATADDCCGRVAPRSGLTWKNGLDFGAGVTDADYTYNTGVALFNHTDLDCRFQIFNVDGTG